MPRKLDASSLSGFKPRQNETKRKDLPTEETSGVSERWPSREPITDGQFTIRAPLATIDRFKKLCKDDRRTYADMLNILMDKSGLD